LAAKFARDSVFLIACWQNKNWLHRNNVNLGKNVMFLPVTPGKE